MVPVSPALWLALLQLPAPAPTLLRPGAQFDTVITPTATHGYLVDLPRGGSAEIRIRQLGVDLVVDLFDPRGVQLATFDSPNGRAGDEPVEILAARAGRYRLQVRPFAPTEPSGPYRVIVAAIRTARETTALLAARARARDSATVWLGRHSVALGQPDSTLAGPAAARLDSLAAAARVLALGEATHGSREFADWRLRLTQRAIERSGYRLVAIEASAARLARLNHLLRGRAPDDVTPLVETGWIGRRALRALIPWLRRWNQAHPADPVSLVGLDAQEFGVELPVLRRFLADAYGERVAENWDGIERELTAADAQTAVFGDSRVDPAVRDRLFTLVTRVRLDAPLLQARLGDTTYQRAAEDLAMVAQFADFNAGQSTPVSHSRDWYMAANLLRALAQGSGAKAILWAHNAHVGHPPDRPLEASPTGTLLRQALGCGYQAIGLTFGAGSFVAQLPNDPEDRLAVDALPPNADESVEQVLTGVGGASVLATWECPPSPAGRPSWLTRPQAMRWVGGLWRPGSNPVEANRPARVLDDYDGLLFVRQVTADELPADRPLVPPRARE